jgi:hypothetical protein
MQGKMTIGSLASTGLWIMTAVATLAFTGCATTPQRGGGAVELAAVRESDIPADVRQLAAAVVLRMRAVDLPAGSGVDFAPGVVDTIAEQGGFAYKGFALRGLRVVETARERENPVTRRTSALLDFEDGYGRTATAVFQTRHVPAGGSITIQSARVYQRYYPRVASRLFLVPVSSLSGEALSQMNSWQQLYEHVVLNSVPVEAFPDRSDRRLFAVAFCLTRISPDARFEVQLSDNDTGACDGYGRNTTYLDYAGWRVGIMGVDAAGPKKEMVVKAFYTPGSEVGLFQRSRSVAGMYRLLPEKAGD